MPHTTSHIKPFKPGDQVRLTAHHIDESLLSGTRVAAVHTRRNDKKMLKVVGASWFQTKLSSYIIIAMSVIGIITIIFGEMASNVEEDGIYSATVFWRQKTGFRVEFWGQGNDLKEIPVGTARAHYKPDMSETGWSLLEIETSKSYPDWVQAYAAGVLEGCLTWQEIYWHWKNTVETACVNYEEQCNDIRQFLEDNEEVLRSIAMLRGDTDEYWHQIKLFYCQIDGMESGWRYAVKRSRQNYDIPSSDFIWMNVMSDLNELERKFELVRNNYTENLPGLSATVLYLFKTKSNAMQRQFEIAQNSANYYNYMLRIMKRYEFNYHRTENPKSALIPGISQIFSSYPGAISSHDDMYQIKSLDQTTNFVVTGTYYNIFNRQMWDKLESSDLIFIAPRVMTANRLATNGFEWSDLIAQGDVGTGNKQWLVLDIGLLNQNVSITTNNTHLNGLLWVVEQIPGHTSASDQTQALLKNGFWASIGIPFYKDIVNVTGNHDKHSEVLYNRKKIENFITRHLNHTNDLQHLVALMSNTSDATKLHNINFRGDFLEDSPIPFGVTDIKFLIGNQNDICFKLKSGPPHSPSHYFNATNDSQLLPLEIVNGTYYMIPAFQWSTSTFDKQVSHIGHPDLWDFQLTKPEWVWDND